MRTLYVVMALVVFACKLPAEEPTVPSKIVAAGLFKNGFAVIKREIALPGPGSYRLEDLPEPVHGTWWVESATTVETTVKMRHVAAPAGTKIHFQDDLAGKAVTVHFKDGKPGPVTGTVLKIAKPMDETAEGLPGHALPVGESAFLVLKTAKGRMFIDRTQIGIVDVEGADEPVRRVQKPVLIVSAPKARKNDKLHITYLTHGLGWAASYRIDITDPKTLTIEQAALVKNELAALDGAELRLISGFPSVQFAHVRLPLSPLQTWDQFFQQLQTAPQPRQGVLSQQAVVLSNYVSPTPAFGLNLNATPSGEGVDLHFQPIGKRALAKGEVLSLSIAKDKANYERIVEWLIPDNRDEHGRYRSRGEQDSEDAWDALRFKNPFDFPMTTGPAMVMANGQFNGQRTSYYVNAGEETMLRVTKALSVRTRHVEQEAAHNNGERDFVFVGGHRYQKSTVAAELVVSNHRKENIKLVIRRRFSGDLVNAEGEPRTALREEGAYSVNKRNELVWIVALKGGEERRLSYRYNVLVAS